jgi:hypothetical protein
MEENKLAGLTRGVVFLPARNGYRRTQGPFFSVKQHP